MNAELDYRNFWWTDTSRHVLRVYFRLRDEPPSQLDEPEKRFVETGRSVMESATSEESDIMRCFYGAGWTGEAIAKCYGASVRRVYAALRRIEKRTAEALGLLKPD